MLTSLTLAPEDPECAALVGRLVGRGFRSLVDEVCEPGTLPWGLLTELPVVALLSGYGTLYSGQLAAPVTDRFIRGVPVDICAGWAGTGFMMEHIKAEHEVPTPDGPDVPLDSAGWHAMPDLAPGALRRQRLIERTGNEIWAMFRDSYARPDGATSVLHEYTVSATISGIDPDDHPSDDPDGDAGDRRSSERISACEATPRVLPWSECPGAAASAGRLVGQRVVDLRSLVRDEFMGTSTCTHLNDLLSSLFQASRLF
ncbi:MAG: DUF2889 domain-containing protein [Acidimicrobiales bacterium]